MALEHFILYIIVFLYGIIIGSFLNVCIYRMPKGESVVTVGSHCMNCKHPLKWYDLLLRGKCRYCGAKISIQYPLVELANGILYVLVVAICGLNPDSILWCVLTSIMIVIAVTDLKTMKFPAVCEILMIVVGGVHLFFHASQWLYYIAGALFMGVFLLVCALLFKKVTGKAGLGLGDIEFMACIGLCIGFGHSLLALIAGCLLGAVIQLYHKKSGRFPTTPYLAMGVYLVLLWGDTVLNWYVRIFVY